MRRLIVLFTIGILCLTALAQAYSSRSYPQALSVSILLIAIASFYENNIFTGIITLFPVATACVLLFLGIEVQTVLVCVAAFLLTPGVSRVFRRQVDKGRKGSDKSFFETRASYEKAKIDEEAIRAANMELEQGALEIAKLYELTKQMSVNLEFEGILKVLSDFIRSNFKYQSAYLFTVSTKNSMPEIEKEYRIGDQKEEKQSFKQLGEKEKVVYALRLVKMLNAAKAPIKTAANFDRYLMQRLDLPKELGSFIAVPIYAKGKMTAALAFEDVELKDFEKLLIAAGQFSLEMERVLLYEEVQALAIIDGLTNIYVRRHFMERFGEELERSKRHKLNLSVLMIDIDHFKQKNDKFGHLVGDVILREVAALIKQNVREIDLAGRYGGEEFSVILVDTNKLDAQLAGERIRKAVESYKFKAYDEVIDVTISAGISSFPQEGQTTESLIEKADSALYEAKNKGRNRVCLTY